MVDSISVTTLKQDIDSGKGRTLLDVREPWEFDLCAIEGSINIPLSRFPEKAGDLELANEVVVICHHGARSFQAACYMETLGIEAKLYNLEGGIDAWADKVDNKMQKY